MFKQFLSRTVIMLVNILTWIGVSVCVPGIRCKIRKLASKASEKYKRSRIILRNNSLPEGSTNFFYEQRRPAKMDYKKNIAIGQFFSISKYQNCLFQ